MKQADENRQELDEYVKEVSKVFAEEKEKLEKIISD